MNPVSLSIEDLAGKNGHVSRDSFNLAGNKTSFSEWATLIQQNFDASFFDEAGFYRDTYGGGGDEKFRCNFPIALAISPSIAKKENAVKSLEEALTKLQSGLGLCTLSPDDVDYRLVLFFYLFYF